MVTFTSQAPRHARDQGLREVLGRVGLAGRERSRGGGRGGRGRVRQRPTGGCCCRHCLLFLTPRVRRGRGGGLPHPVVGLEKVGGVRCD